MSTVVVRPYRTLEFLEGGGHFWVYLQYVHGLRQVGCDVYWVEHFDSRGTGHQKSRVQRMLRRLERYGLAGKVILCTESGGEPTFIGATRSEAHKLFERAGLLQMWMSTGLLSVAPHDLHFTTGETVGMPSALFPDGGLEWVHIRPPVCLDLWPYTYDPRC